MAFEDIVKKLSNRVKGKASEFMSKAKKFKMPKRPSEKMPYPITKDPKTGRETHDLRGPLEKVIRNRRGMNDGSGGPGMKKNC